MSSPPQPHQQFSFKVPQPKSSPVIHGGQPSSSMSSSYGSHGHNFSGFKQEPMTQLSDQQPLFGHNSFTGTPRYQTSATRGHQSNASMDSVFEGGMAVSVGDRPGSYQPPDSHNRIPSTPILFPTRHAQYSHTTAWETRNPPPLSSGSTAAYTHALMTPSTSRGTPYPPVYGFQVRGNHDSPSYHQLIPVTPQHVYTTPTPASRRPQLMTTPSSLSMIAKYKPLPARHLPGPTPQPQFILPAPADEPSKRPWPSSEGDVFYKQPHGPPPRYFLSSPPTPSKACKEHRCPTCDKPFARPSALKTHQAVHTGAKPFQCPSLQCGKRFSVLSNMRRHVRTHDRLETKPRILKGLRMGCNSSDDYEGQEEESDDLHSPVRMQFDISRPARSRVKRVPVVFDNSMLGNAGAMPAYQVSEQHFGFAN